MASDMANHDSAESLVSGLDAEALDRSFMCPASAVLCLSFSEADLKEDLKEMQRSSPRLFTRYAAGARWYHELIHYWQTFYSYNLSQIAVLERGNIAWLQLNLSSLFPSGEINVPLARDRKGPFDINDLSCRLNMEVGPLRLSIRHLLEGQATFESFVSCRNFANGDSLARAFRSISATNHPDSHYYTRAYLAFYEKFPSFAVTLFPIACHLSIAGVWYATTNQISHPGWLFQDVINYFSAMESCLELIHSRACQDMAATYREVTRNFCALTKTEYCGPSFVASCIRKSGMLEKYTNQPGVLFWPLLTQEAEAACSREKADLFFSPILTGSTEMLFDRLGDPLILCKDGEAISAYFDPTKPEQEPGAVFSHTNVHCYRSMFAATAPRIYCPHRTCPHHKTALCHLFPWVPENPSECRFPLLFKMFFGVPIERLRRS